jgi:hypothetical protein
MTLFLIQLHILGKNGLWQNLKQVCPWPKSLEEQDLEKNLKMLLASARPLQSIQGWSGVIFVNRYGILSDSREKDARCSIWEGQLRLLEMVMEDLFFLWASSTYIVDGHFFSFLLEATFLSRKVENC